MFPVRYEQVLYIPEEGILHSYRRETAKSYIEHVDFHTTDEISYLNIPYWPLAQSTEKYSVGLRTKH
jgi:hypothetical protein